MIRTRTLAAIGTAVLLLGSPLFAQPSSSNSSKQLIVTSASVDRLNDTVTLKGSGFGNKKPTVFCELTQMTVLSATDEELLVAFPASVLDGTYLFTVARGNGTSERATFFVTTNRPQILEGQPGPAGAQGPKGDKGDKGDRRAGRAGRARSPGRARAAGREGRSGPAGFQRRHRRERTSGSRRSPGATGPGRTAGIGGAAGRRRANRSTGRAGLDRTNWTGWSAGCSRYQRLRALRQR